LGMNFFLIWFDLIWFDSVQAGSCGGFVRTYKAICDYLNLSPRQDICWDVDNILHFGGVHEFNLVDYFYSKVHSHFNYVIWYAHSLSSHFFDTEKINKRRERREREKMESTYIILFFVLFAFVGQL
jgi:hypothetical protein